ncbi:hypothetical protein [Alcanivorax quisquiliarum]|uniref:Uncharacterized protein n=1 Tax=Alcanivorax quisquiliarum TaxID=2933565 RepID=A0ABT0EAA5_9GAMM|nr:hypothetical protein [Alcanivorax quisquiliarum]MCK0538574.1 hypothetical protein [Alcanivorax quisquiliarum]
MNMIAKGIFGAALVAAAGLAQATAPIYYTVNDDPTVYQLDLNPITDTFFGPSTVSSGLCSIPCTLSATGTLSDVIGGDTTLSVGHASVSGGLLCSAVSLSGFPWVGSVEHNSIPSPLGPVTFTLEGVSVSAPICGSCSDKIDVTFDPANGGSFVFNGPITPNGNCHVNGTLTSNNNYYASH